VGNAQLNLSIAVQSLSSSGKLLCLDSAPSLGWSIDERLLYSVFQLLVR
jgi:hypothetical protein